MNKHIFRLVYNRLRGMLMAVSETVASAHQSGDKARAGRASVRRTARHISHISLFPMHATAFAALVSLGVTPVLVHAQVTGAGAQAPSVVQTPNGLQQVNINAPSAAGVSQNTYSQFDVPRAGVIVLLANKNYPIAERVRVAHQILTTLDGTRPAIQPAK